MFLRLQRCLLLLTLFAGALFQIGLPAERQNRDAPPQSGAAPKHPIVAASLDMMSDKAGVDFNPYLREVYFSVKKSWLGYNLPPSIEKGLQGKNTVEFRILQDGSIPKDSLKMIASSEKSELDAASLAAVREAAPFSHLPEKFSEPFIVLRMTFYYNVTPQKPQ
ncbi:MAG TPA: energy transducer TonB [Candidatus Baltobacteraceae bacterium]|jgi:TonB family protein|nr:energy transducer TonB [Candidatus Baltobacteraceae bacterium]